MTHTQLSDHVSELRRLSDLLVPHSFPRVEMEEELEIMPLKCRNIIVDGYDMVASFSKADYGTYLIESVHLRPIYTPFLPFGLVCSVARAFLGPDHLSYVDFIRGHKRIYCWTVRKKRGRAVPATRRSSPSTYDGFSYRTLDVGPAEQAI